MADDPIWETYQKTEGFKKPDAVEETNPFSVVSDETDVVFRPARLPDPETIPPRPWLYGTQLLRGYVSVIVAPGGVGKTCYAMGVCLALASGRPLFGEKIFQRANVAYVNLEDPLDELERRLAALMIHHGIARSEVEGRFFLYSGDDKRVTIAAPSKDGTEIIYPDAAAIMREINHNKIDVLVIDPFAESHDLEENSNPQMLGAVSAWRRIARSTKCSDLLIHHVRKGKVTDIDASRGAKALTDAGRVGLLLSQMTEEEAEKFDIEPADRTSFVRLDDAKSNMARKAGEAKWFKLETVELGNGTASYPAGDRVAAISRWYPPSAMGDLTIAQCNEAIDLIDKGPVEGVRYTPSNAGKTNRWAGDVLIEMFSMSKQRAGSILAIWLKNGALELRDYKDAEQRKVRTGLFAVAAKRPGNSFS